MSAPSAFNGPPPRRKRRGPVEANPPSSRPAHPRKPSAPETTEPVAQPVEGVTVTGTSFRGVAPVGGNLVSVSRDVIEKSIADSGFQLYKIKTDK